jgi:hypothetical protein
VDKVEERTPEADDCAGAETDGTGVPPAPAPAPLPPLDAFAHDIVVRSCWFSFAVRPCGRVSQLDRQTDRQTDRLCGVLALGGRQKVWCGWESRACLK